MSGLRTAITAARSIGKNQAQDWLYRPANAAFPQFELSAWRATCHAEAVQEYQHAENSQVLICEWSTAFESAIDDSKDHSDQTVTRATLSADIWTTESFERRPFLLARRGDIVNVQPSYIDQWPLTIIPRNGPAFGEKNFDLLRDVEKVDLTDGAASATQGAADA